MFSLVKEKERPDDTVQKWGERKTGYKKERMCVASGMILPFFVMKPLYRTLFHSRLVKKTTTQ